MAKESVVARKGSPRCPRCFQPIISGQRIEMIGRKKGRFVYAHEGCKAPGGVTVATEQEAQELATDLTYEADDVSPEAVQSAFENSNDAVALASEVEELVLAKSQRIISQAVENALPKLQEEVRKSCGDVTREIIKGSQGQVNAWLDSAKIIVGDLVKVTAQTVEDRVKALVAEHAKTLVKHVHVIRRGEVEAALKMKEGEVFHEAFDEVLELTGSGFDVFLPGPTGSGKTYIAEQVARALGLPFVVISGSAGTTEAEILGTSQPNVMTGESVYLETQFVKAYEGGGVALLDEADAMDSNCLLKVNSAVGNGYLSIPKRLKAPVARRHKDFVFIMAANTFGHGATRQYCGRNRLDEATLDRFRGSTVPMDYDRNIEVAVCGNDMELCETLWGWRKTIFDRGLHRILSTRFMAKAFILKNVLGKDMSYVAKKLVMGWTPAEAREVVGGLAS